MKVFYSYSKITIENAIIKMLRFSVAYLFKALYQNVSLSFSDINTFGHSANFDNPKSFLPALTRTSWWYPIWISLLINKYKPNLNVQGRSILLSPFLYLIWMFEALPFLLTFSKPNLNVQGSSILLLTFSKLRLCCICLWRSIACPSFSITPSTSSYNWPF